MALETSAHNPYTAVRSTKPRLVAHDGLFWNGAWRASAPRRADREPQLMTTASSLQACMHVLAFSRHAQSASHVVLGKVMTGQRAVVYAAACSALQSQADTFKQASSVPMQRICPREQDRAHL